MDKIKELIGHLEKLSIMSSAHAKDNDGGSGSFDIVEHFVSTFDKVITFREIKPKNYNDFFFVDQKPSTIPGVEKFTGLTVLMNGLFKTYKFSKENFNLELAERTKAALYNILLKARGIQLELEIVNKIQETITKIEAL